MRFGQAESSPSLVAPRVAVVDSFDRGATSHGNLVSAVLRQQLPHAQIIPFPVERKPGYLAIGEALQGVAQAVKGGLKLDALNLSMGTMRPLSDMRGDVLAGQHTVNSTPMAQLLAEAEHHPTDPTSAQEQEPLSAVAGGLKALQELVKKGIKVFIAAGNNGAENVNVFTLAPGVHSVGALTPQGTPWERSGKNSWVTGWAVGEHDVVIEGVPHHVGPGTSFSTPTALALALT